MFQCTIFEFSINLVVRAFQWAEWSVCFYGPDGLAVLVD